MTSKHKNNGLRRLLAKGMLKLMKISRTHLLPSIGLLMELNRALKLMKSSTHLQMIKVLLIVGLFMVNTLKQDSLCLQMILI